MKQFKALIHLVLLLLLLSCGVAERKMYTDLDKSGSIFLSRYTALLPTLGPCGFTRDEDSYVIRTPRITGRVEATELRITRFTRDTARYQYAGFIEFLGDDVLTVELFKINGGKRTKLKINGKNKIKVEANKVGDKAI